MPKDKESSHSEPGQDLGARFPVGRIVGVYGLAGYVKIKPTCNNPQLLLDVRQVQVSLPNGVIYDCTVKDIYFDHNLIFMRLEDFPDRTAVEKLINSSVSTTRSQLRDLDENEWWIDDLIGLPVYTTDGVHIGTISDVIGPKAELLEIKRIDQQKSEPVLVPFVEALVPVVDLNRRRIEVVDLPGLLNE